ncbi:MAG: CPBP family intramembrane glutamic endopeptidase [Pyrinomonadaceae bacterium]
MKLDSKMRKENSIQWQLLLIGFVAVFALFHMTASVLGSERGEFGVLIGLLVVISLISIEIILFGRSAQKAFEAVGLHCSSRAGILIVIIISVLLLLMIAAFALITDSSFNFYTNWYLLVPGLFFQAGIAEEILFRGYLFGHIRRRHSFWKAAVFAAIPFILVHMILFYSLSWVIALASIFLSVVLSFPFARLFELGGCTIWAPAILHFVIQGAVKILNVSGEFAEFFPLFWIGVCAFIPLLVFAIPRPLTRVKTFDTHSS